MSPNVTAKWASCRRYTCAEEVIAWLGSQDEDSTISLEIYKTLWSSVRSLIDDESWGLVLKYGPDDNEFIQRVRTAISTPDMWNAYHRFYQRAWFNQTWVAQEITLAKKLTMYWGSQEFSWNAIIGLDYYLEMSPWRLVIWNLGSGRGNFADYPRPIPSIRILQEFYFQGRMAMENWRILGYSNRNISQANLYLEILHLTRRSEASDKLGK